jgi:hypothetical protein
MILRRSRSLSDEPADPKELKLDLDAAIKYLEQKMMELGCIFSTRLPGPTGQFTVLVQNIEEEDLDQAALIIFSRRELHQPYIGDAMVVHRMPSSVGSSLTQCIIQYNATITATSTANRGSRVTPSESEI